MKRLCSLAMGLLLFAVLGCTSEDKRQWHEALREWRGENIQYRFPYRPSP